ncbi:hypothetical protein P7C73_g4743, partial [Tremellales sp. Uapishka_1]
MPDDADDTVNPLFGATPPTDAATESKPVPELTTDRPAEGEVDQTGNPLFGATPSSSPPPPAETARERLEASSSDRALPPPVPARPTSQPVSHRPSSIPSFLRRLTYVLSVILGTSSVIAGIWSFLLLPLLHSSFSARLALAEAQRSRWDELVIKLRTLSERRLYLRTKELDPGLVEEVELKVKFEELPSRSGSVSSPPPMLDENIVDPSPSLHTLSSSLNELSAALSSTSTTRTSLLASLTSYTSQMHREMFVSRGVAKGGFGGYGVGMNTLSANLAKEGGGGGSD